MIATKMMAMIPKSRKSNKSFQQIVINCVCGKVLSFLLLGQGIINSSKRSRVCSCGIKYEITLPRSI